MCDIRFASRPADAVELAGGAVHVLTFDLADAPTDAVCLAQLSPAEQARAARLRANRVRRQFLACRSWLRRMLAAYLDCAPSAVPLTSAAGGKPILDPFANPQRLEFNLSHSQTTAALVVACGRRVGIDIEAIRPLGNAAGIIARFFSAQEQAWFQELPEELRSVGFFVGWTRKEAFLKALGEGVQSFERCTITLDPRLPPAVVAFDGDSSIGQRWHLTDWQPRPDLSGAIAVERR